MLARLLLIVGWGGQDTRALQGRLEPIVDVLGGYKSDIQRESDEVRF